MKRLFVLFLFITSSLFSYENTLSICAIFQNEGPYLKEWIDYHHSHGAEKFYLYNNNSTDDYEKVLKPYIKKGLVKLIEWPSVQEENDWANYSFTVQTGAYNDAITKTRGISKWLALIDIDEYIICNDIGNIAIFLEKNYPNVSGLCVNWQCYGTSNIEKVPDGQMTKYLLWKMRWNHDWNKHSKSIVQPLHVEHCPNPHFCVYKNGHWAIDTHGNKCDSCPDSVYIDRIRINHYWTKDEWFLHNVKIPRYQKWGNNINNVLKHASDMNEEYDPILSHSSR